MAKFVDIFLIPVPKKNKKAYLTMAKKSAKLWIKNGALKYMDSIGSDVKKGKITSLPKSVKLKPSEFVAFGCAAFRSKQHRNQVMKKLHRDPELMALWDNMPFDGMRMIFGGFQVAVKKERK